MPEIRRLASLNPEQAHGLCELLMDAVDGGASVGFLSPLPLEIAAAYWRTVAATLDSGLALLVAEDNGAIVGSVQLSPCPKDNGRHRAEVQKLFVLRSHRGKGLATRLMRAAEDHAAALGRTLLVLDTHQGSAAEAVYEHLGWTRAGVIPDYAACPDGTLHGTVLFYKKIGPDPA